MVFIKLGVILRAASSKYLNNLSSSKLKEYVTLVFNSYRIDYWHNIINHI
jgi:hypothetical protein